jgi:hypothetical protein
MHQEFGSMKKVLFILILASFSCTTAAEEELSVTHVLQHDSGQEEVRASYHSQASDSVQFTFSCSDTDRFEYNWQSLKKGRADASSLLECPQTVIVKAETDYNILTDSLDVATIRKINRR